MRRGSVEVAEILRDEGDGGGRDDGDVGQQNTVTRTIIKQPSRCNWRGPRVGSKNTPHVGAGNCGGCMVTSPPDEERGAL